MDEVNFRCKVCASTSYTLTDGFFYCDDCGMQNEQQFMHDDFAIRKGDKTLIKEKAATETDPDKGKN